MGEWEYVSGRIGEPGKRGNAGSDLAEAISLMAPIRPIGPFRLSHSRIPPLALSPIIEE